MGQTFECKSMRQFLAIFAQHQRKRMRNIERAIARTARKGAKIIRGNVPKAFGELADSVEAKAKRIEVDAPHAAPVETGSRPHTPPLEPLIRWVKLRGMQGIDSRGRVKSNRTRYGVIKNPNREQSRRVATELKSRERGGALGVDAPKQVALAIQRAISIGGTKPHWYTRGSLSAIAAALHHEMTTGKPLDV
jgi:hypothetical protein